MCDSQVQSEQFSVIISGHVDLARLKKSARFSLMVRKKAKEGVAAPQSQAISSMRPWSFAACLLIAWLRAAATGCSCAPAHAWPLPDSQQALSPGSGPAPACSGGLTSGELAAGVPPSGRREGTGQGFAPARGILRVRDELRCMGLRGAGGLPRKGGGDYYDDMDDEDSSCADEAYTPRRTQKVRQAASTIADGRPDVPHVGVEGTGGLSPAARLFLADQEEGEDEERDNESNTAEDDGPDGALSVDADAGKAQYYNEGSDAASAPARQEDEQNVQKTGPDADHGLGTSGAEDARSGADDSLQSRGTEKISPGTEASGDDALVRQLEDELETVVGVHEAVACGSGPASAPGAGDPSGTGLYGTDASVCAKMPLRPTICSTSPPPETVAMASEAVAEDASALTDVEMQAQTKGDNEQDASRAVAVTREPASTGQGGRGPRRLEAPEAHALEAPRSASKAPSSASRPSTQTLALKIQRLVVATGLLIFHVAAATLAPRCTSQPVQQAGALFSCNDRARAAGGARRTRARK